MMALVGKRERSQRLFKAAGERVAIQGLFDANILPDKRGSRRGGVSRKPTAGRRVLHHQRRDPALATLAVGHFWGEGLKLLENWRGASFADLIHQTGFGEPGKGAPHGDEDSCFAAHT